MTDSPTLVLRAMRFFWAPAAHDDKEAQPLLEKEDTSPLVVFCFVVNSCIGVGFLSLPRAFDKAGLFWASFLCILMGAISLASSTWVVHTMSNTEALLRYLSVDAEGGGAELEAARRVPNFAISARKNELSQQIAFLFGNGWKQVYLVVLSYLMYTCLWCFASVFAASMAARIPLPFVGANNQFTCDLYTNQSWDCRLLYLEHLVVFAVVCIPCSIVKLQETTGFQIAMSFARFILIGLIVADSVRMLISAEAPPNFYKYDPTYYPQPSGSMHFGYTREVLSIAVFALYVQMMIPTTTQTLHNKEGTMLPTVWTAIMFCVVVYLAVGVLVALVFGNDTLPVASLNWRNFTGGQETAPEWATTFSTMLILFPTVDILSAFPLIAFCLGENLSQTAPGLSQRYGSWISTYWRLLAAVPPIFGAILIDNVAVLFEYGAIGAWLMIVAFPAACVLRSQQLCDERFGKEASRNNPYKTRLSDLWVIYTVCGVSAVLYAYHLGSFLTHKLGLE